MKNKRSTAIVGLALAGTMITTPLMSNTGIKAGIKNVSLLAGTTINNTVNNDGGNSNTTINNTVNNNQGTNNSGNDIKKQDNQTTTPASSKVGYKAGQVIVTLGANLTLPERQQMMQDFGVSTSDTSIKFVSTTNRDIAIELGMNPNTINPGSTSISSTKVTLLPKGSGISVSTNNLTQVTGDMLASALVTCGINDASIVANAPYPVTGQAALAGILQGFQDVTGSQIPEQNKKVANQEVNTTLQLGNQIGQTKAENIVTQAKQKVIDQKPSTTVEINNIVNNAAQNNSITLTQAQQQELDNLMQQIKDLNISADQANGTLSQIQSSIEKGKKDFSNVSEKVKNEFDKLNKEGFFTKIGDFFSNLWHDIATFFDGGTKAVETQGTQNADSSTTSQSNATTDNSGTANGATNSTTTTTTSNDNNGSITSTQNNSQANGQTTTTQNVSTQSQTN